jgi:anti-sigma factor RsiW
VADCPPIDTWLLDGPVCTLSDYRARLEHTRNCERCATRHRELLELKRRLGAAIVTRPVEESVELVLARLAVRAPPAPAEQPRLSPLQAWFAAAICLATVFCPLFLAPLQSEPGLTSSVAALEPLRFLSRDTAAGPGPMPSVLSTPAHAPTHHLAR